MTRADLRLTALLACAGLATRRIGLVVHELVGHGVAVGGTVTDVQRVPGHGPRGRGGDHPTFPFAYVLGALVVVSIGPGAARPRASPGGRVPARLLALAATIAGGSITPVIALDAAFL